MMPPTPLKAMPREGAQRYLVSRTQRHGPYDLVIVADGSVSELHDDTTIPTSVKPYPWGALWFVAEDRERAHGPCLDQIVHRARTMCGLLPTGLGPRGDTPLVVINPEPNPFSELIKHVSAGVFLQGRAGEWVPDLVPVLSPLAVAPPASRRS